METVSITNCATINCHSIGNKTADLKTDIIHTNLNMCILRETWIKEDDTTTSALLCPLGYKSLLIQRKKWAGGGIALVYSDTVTAKVSQIHRYESMQCTSFTVNLPTDVLHPVAVYRPPDRRFALDMLDLMKRSINVVGKLVPTGDFNIRINDINCPEMTNTFLDLLECLGLTNQIRFATHESSSSIDLVITPEGTNYIRDPKQGRLFSHHHIVVFNVITTKGLSSIKETTYWKIRHKHSTVPDQYHQLFGII